MEDDDGYTQLLAADDAELLKPQYAIYGLLPAEGVMVVTGATSSGKSSLAIATAAFVASGRSEFAERSIHAWDGAVLHLDPEGSQVSISGRMQALYSAHGFSDYEQRECESHYLHRTKPSRRLLGGLVDDELRRLDGRSIAMIVVDGLLRLSGAENENDNASMVTAMDELARFSNELGAPVWINHHTAKAHQSGRGANVSRGASAVEDAADVVARVDHDLDTGDRTFTIGKGRDIGLPPNSLTYEIAGWARGRDANGVSLTSPVAVDFTWTARQKKTAGDTAAEALIQRLVEALGGDELHTKQLTERGFDRRKLGDLRRRRQSLLDQFGLRYRKNGSGGYWSISEGD